MECQVKLPKEIVKSPLVTQNLPGCGSVYSDLDKLALARGLD